MLTYVRRQVLVQLSDELIAALDERAAELGISRSALIRRALEEHLGEDLRTEIDRRILDGYGRIPPEDPWGDLPARAMIAAEPW